MRPIYFLIALIAILVVGVVLYTIGNSEENFNSNKSAPSTTGGATTINSHMQITSAAFQNNGSIPSKFTCDASSPPSPEISFSDIPEGAKSLALIVDDPDVPKAVLPAGVFDHWVLFNISPTTTKIGEGSTSGIGGNNGTGKIGYIGPCPPPQYEPSEHRYMFTLYALDTMLDLPKGASKQQVLSAAKGHILEQTQLVGRYKRTTTTTR